MSYSKEKQFVSDFLNQAKQIVVGRHAPLQIKQKSAFDLVTALDMEIEQMSIERLSQAFPQDRILSEETNFDTQLQGRTWSVDPIDGTCNMARESKLFGVQISLIENGEVVVAGVTLPFLDETYIAVRGGGAFLNGQKVSVQPNTELNNVLVSFGDYKHNDDAMAALQHKAIGFLYKKIAKIRMYGSACIDFSFVGCGKTDGTVVITKNVWDIAPGILIAQEGGAIITNLQGKPFHFGDTGVIAAANAKVSALLVESLS